VGVVSAKLDALKLASVTGDVPENVNFAVKYLIVRNFLDTHAVRYETSPSTAQLSAADIADRVKKSTVFVSCE
jgi:serine protease Do